MKKYFDRNGFFIVTLVLFLTSLVLHLVWGWFFFVYESAKEQEYPDFAVFILQWGRDVMENWQSEFLQTIWVVVALKYLKFVGSPQSKEGMERMEEKIDYLTRKIVEGDHIEEDKLTRYQKELEKKYPKD